MEVDSPGGEERLGLNLAEDEMKVSAQQPEDTCQNEHILISLSFQSWTTIRGTAWR